jgi:hypothetical protein
MLYVYVPDRSLSLQNISKRYFRLIEHGTVPSRPPNADCALPARGVYYQVVAVHPGRALLPLGRQWHTTVRVIA